MVFTPGMLAMAVMTGTFVSLAISLTVMRDNGQLKRVRGTPLPPWVYITARIGSAVWFSMVSAVVMVVVAVLLFHVEVVGRTLPAAVVTLLAGAACFCALGMAVAAVIPNGEAAPVIANFTFFPIAFISDLFFPTAGAPAWVGTVGSIFPVRHFAVALENTFNPLRPGNGFQWGHLAVMGLWTVAAIVVAVRLFRWEPKVGASRGGRRAGRVAEADPTA